MEHPQPGDDCLVCALKCLHLNVPCEKARQTEVAFKLWKAGEIRLPDPSTAAPTAPDHPGRCEKVRLVPSHQLRSRGKGGSVASRQAMLHSLCHIECCAIDLAWDLILRFGGDPAYRGLLPRQFFDDWITVAADEARHFSLLLARLQATGMDYGDLPAHDGLWESAIETACSLAARLAIEHCTHEARGLDVLPKTIARFRAGGDDASAELLEKIIYAEEVSHCAAGVRWLRALHAAAVEGTVPNPGAAWVVDARAHPTVEQWFHALVRRHFHGLLKPPFNDEARAKAGFGPEWYLPLADAPIESIAS